MNPRLASTLAPAIARLAGTTRQHVMRALKGENRLSFGMAVRIAKAAGVTCDELAAHVYEGDEEMQGWLKAIEQRKKAAK